MKLILVTGIEGFVGRHLTRALVDAGYSVAGIHLAPAPAGMPARLFEGNVCDFHWLRQTLSQIKPDAVIHLAAVSSVADAENQLLGTFEVNASGTLKLLAALSELALRPRVLLISSGSVYGCGTRTPFTEEMPPDPIDAYALSKQVAEDIGRFFFRAYGADVVILRPFSHTGPGQSPSFVFSSVARQIAELERQGATTGTIELGNLDVRRDYVDVRDIVRAYILAIEKTSGGETYNVTSGSAVSIREGVEKLCRLARVRVTYTSTASRRRDRDLPNLTGDPTKFQTVTGWKPQISFDQTLADLLEYWRSQ
ncbi:MAG: GDP-mannose 4,6-dehydratase [candidate division WOR-3 bacterium]